jgi:hypothetical protein
MGEGRKPARSSLVAPIRVRQMSYRGSSHKPFDAVPPRGASSGQCMAADTAVSPVTENHSAIPHEELSAISLVVRLVQRFQGTDLLDSMPQCAAQGHESCKYAETGDVGADS